MPTWPLWGRYRAGPHLAGPEWQTPGPLVLAVSKAAPRLRPMHFRAQGDKVIIFFHIRNVKLIKETNTFNETYVGHLEDLQRVRCETRRLMESVK